LLKFYAVKHTPSVISIGERCLEMGYAFYWPPYSESPFLVEPDGAHVVMTVENNIPYLTGGNDDAACPGVEEEDGNAANEGSAQSDANSVVPNGEVDENATPRGDDLSQSVDNAQQADVGPISHDDVEVGRMGSHNPGDVEPVYSRDFKETAKEALTMRHLSTHKPKLNSCETCRRAKAQRVRHLRATRKAENAMRKSRGPVPLKFGDQVAMDHIIVRSELNHGYKGQTNALTMMDRAAGFSLGKRT
jgi:hypothetical protein